MSREGNVAMSNGVVEAPRRRTVHFTIGEKRRHFVKGSLGGLELDHPVDRLRNDTRIDVQVIFPLVEIGFGQNAGAESRQPNRFRRIIPIGSEIRKGAVSVLERQLALISDVQVVKRL